MTMTKLPFLNKCHTTHLGLIDKLMGLHNIINVWAQTLCNVEMSAADKENVI